MGAVRFPKGLRWECRGCAACCSGGFELGPVEPEVIARLQQEGIEQRWAPAADGQWATLRRSMPGPDGQVQEAWFLRQQGGRCIFLRPDDRCAIHAELGPSFKPGFCREFPYHFVHDPQGVVAVIRPDCAGFHESSQDGPVLDEDAVSEVLALPRAAPRRVFAPSSVRVLGSAVPLADWLSLEASLLDWLEATSRPTGTLGQILAPIRTQLVQLAAEPLPAPDPGRAQAALAALASVLEQVLRQVATQPGPPDRVAFVEKMADRMGRVRILASTQEDLAGAPLSPELGRYVELLVRSAVMARQWQPHGTVEAGLGALLFGLLYGVLAGGTERAAFDEAYRDWTKLSSNAVTGMVLTRASPALVELFLYLG